ncbi:MAG: hypothetical protein H6R12_722 [Proteobacteria bacterium]|jgi:hypothetical protein|nr:hypothetical protein [Pseudomonadota bacterium]
MSLSRSTKRTRFIVLLILLALFDCSCTTWKVQTNAPSAVVSGKNARQVRLGFADHSKAIVYGPAIDGSNLVGWKTSDQKGPRNAVYPLTDIQSIEVRGISAGRSIALVAGIGVGVTIIAVAVLAAGMSSPTSTSQSGSFSCPFVYTYTDQGWRLDSGTFGGAIMRPLVRTDVDNLDFARPRDGVLRLKVANELDETDYLDAIEVLAIDHELGTTVGPSPQGSIHALGPMAAPMHARDFEGRDVLASVRASDGRNWESRLAARDPAVAESLRDGIELEFAMPANGTSARLVVDAQNTPWSSFLLQQFIQAHGTGTADWYASLEAEPEQARQLQALFAREAFLHVSVWTGRGWDDRGVLWEVGPEIGKRQLVPLDLAGVSGETLRVRLDAPASFWLVDFVGLDCGNERGFSTRSLAMQSAIDRKGRNLREVLVSADGREERLERGDSIEVRFGAPPLIPGQARSYILRSTGWYKIHAPEEGPPDLSLLSSVSVPGGIARISAVRMNAALERLSIETGVK